MAKLKYHDGTSWKQIAPSQEDFIAHKEETATQDIAGHIKLSDLPKSTIKDDVTGSEYKWGVANGLVYLEEV